ncbi:MAG: elongation factor EF-2 [Candidatus Thermoplasmatota archaeon]|jgi:elongation factor 2|nr:elongation factor EF-2 [Candidatus Thermoplasmatota archaeon]
MTHVRSELAEAIPGMMRNVDRIRNIGIVAHIHHGKTTLSDNLLAAAGMISNELAGKQLFLNFDEQEQARLLTINNADVTIVHEFENQNYLINLIDTPGHVDFGGDVTRAMRAVDGAIVVVCAVEGVMAQTETVLRQALREKVKPTLFINKVDRAIKELKLTPESLQKRFTNIISEVNELIRRMAPEEFIDEWSVDPRDGSVAFGSGYENWAISVPYMLKTGIKFPDIIDYVSTGRAREIAQKAKINDVIFDMVVRHLPSPHVAQRYRIPNIWKGDSGSAIGQAMVATATDGPTSFMVTDITMDPNAGEIATGRLFSGKLVKGMDLYVAGAKAKDRVQHVSLFMGPERLMVEEVTAGNIAAVIGLSDAFAGTTMSSIPDMTPFEEIRHVSEPVVTVAIEPKHMGDLPKLIEVMRKVGKEDASLRVEINQETGEHLLSGMGELHLEITQYRIVNDYKVEIEASKPIVVYRETVRNPGGPFEGKSPNKHNRFYFEVEPLPAAVVHAIHEGEVPQGKSFKDLKTLVSKLDALGLPREEGRGLVAVEGTNMLLDVTKGIQYLNETMDLIIDAFKEAMGRGPLANERVYGLKVRLVDAKLHEDSIHRGPAQTIPAARSGIYGAMVLGDRLLLEPMQKVTVNVPQEILAGATRELQRRRGEILDMTSVGDLQTIVAKVPVAEMFGFASDIRSATAGKVLWATESMGFEPIPVELQPKVVAEVRQRRGLKPEPYDAAYYAG